MQLHNGTSILDWKYYEKQAKSMDVASLLYVIKDCAEAMKSAPDEANYPCKASGFYADELHVYHEELRKRRK